MIERRPTPRPSSAASRSAASRSSRPTPSTAWPASPTTARPSRACTSLKRRRPDKPAAVMFFDRELALAALPELGPRTRARARGAAARRRDAAAAQPGSPLPAGLRPGPRDARPARAGVAAGARGARAPSAGRCCSPARTTRAARRRARSPTCPSAIRARRRPRPRRRRAARARRRRWSTCARYERDGAWSIARAGAVAEDAVARGAQPLSARREAEAVAGGVARSPGPRRWRRARPACTGPRDRARRRRAAPATRSPRRAERAEVDRRPAAPRPAHRRVQAADRLVRRDEQDAAARPGRAARR